MLNNNDELCNIDDHQNLRTLNKSALSSDQDNNSTKEIFDSISKEFKKKSKDKKLKFLQQSPSQYADTYETEENHKSIKDKLVLYENELKSLMEDKLSLQFELNELKIKLFQNKKVKEPKEMVMSVESIKSVNSVKSNVSEPNEVTKQFIHETSNIKDEMANINKLIEKQKNFLTHIDDELLNDSIEEIKLSPALNVDSKENNVNTTGSNLKMEEVLKEINKIKSDMYSLVELVQVCLPNNNLSNIIKPHNQISKDNIQESLDEMKSIENDLRNRITNVQQNDTKNERESNSTPSIELNELPDIHSYFKLNKRMILVDTDFNLWQLGKCKEYDDFCKENKEKYNNNKQKLFNAFTCQDEDEAEGEGEEAEADGEAEKIIEDESILMEENEEKKVNKQGKTEEEFNISDSD